MKKLLSLLLVLVMLFALAACGGSQTGGNTTEPDNSADSSDNEQPTGQDNDTPDNPPAEGGKQYEGVTLNYWYMWNAAEAQGQVIAAAAEAF